ncbi:MAG: FlgD immunoglobulin-like domain containing protein [Candidatus Krumholzibacteria bacterium]|nr:FlgD immunoglobulin-like domain containing protein [Candidatus Krumholzibacteria bacterium]MDP6668676.1 FlgD immunoglobulin-like domain containing protein [Candidatus Krumholzibacteria bacterium]MDP6797895.1 FlgD immunoglobulin-like domain containing protein [Candidatus Krumholzibacteria bacterium]MDP7021769.1 FlgD immunoglobulin-like domain containing protein [Candidatus Krumholzibacteria bacterium]
MTFARTFTLLLSLTTIAFAYDSEWPPLKDPDASDPTPAPGLEMGHIAITIPTEFGAWFQHIHINDWGEFPLGVAFGDLEGADEQQDLDLVLYMRDEIVLCARLDVDFQTETGVLTPLWCWKVPGAPADPPSASHTGNFATNPVIWDLNSDGECEVILVAPKQLDGGDWGRAIYVLKSDPDGVPGDFSVPPPMILAESPAGTYSQTSEVLDRIGICKVRDGDSPRNIVSNDHSGVSLSIWSLASNGQGGSYLDMLHRVEWSPPKTHEYNWLDVDGDGFDEFFWDGILDFVDAGPDSAEPSNPDDPLAGVWRWRSGIGENWNHQDQMFGFDFDPDHPGLEIVSLPEFDWIDLDGIPRRAVDTLWDLDGNILRENADCPHHHLQAAYCGNWTESRDGFEIIFVPKSFSAPTVGGGETWLAGAFSVDIQQEELTLDGAYWKVADLGYPGNHPKRASGPAKEMAPIDWDGDRNRDEILNECWECFYIWRMGEKGDWGEQPPSGMPDEQEVQNPWTEEGYEVWWDFYQGYNGNEVDSKGWNHGGAGLYTHYFEKLGEAYPGHASYILTAYDAGKDYREEALAVTPLAVNVYFNRRPIPAGHQAASPNTDPDYRLFRMAGMNWPYAYAPSDITGVDDSTPSAPTVARLHPNHPNPFNPQTTLQFTLTEAIEIRLAVYDLRGRFLALLATGPWGAGTHAITWDACNAQGREMASGVYQARLTAGGVVESQKLVLVR